MAHDITELYASIEKGREGKNVGLDTGLGKLNKIVYGIQKQSLVVIGAGTAGGKTTMAIYCYVKQALNQLLESKPLKLVYYSFELSRTVLYAKLLALHIYESERVIIPYKTILSLDATISEEHYNLVLKYRDWLNKVSAIMTIVDHGITAEQFQKTQMKIYESVGRFVNTEGHVRYIYNDPDQYVINIIDHIGLLAVGPRRTLKEEIDDTIKHIITFRNNCGGTYVVVQQLNRTGSSMDRRKYDMQEIMLSDFKDSGGTTEGADVVIGLYNPHRDKLLTSRGYNIADSTDGTKGLGSAYRSVQVLKIF